MRDCDDTTADTDTVGDVKPFLSWRRPDRRVTDPTRASFARFGEHFDPAPAARGMLWPPASDGAVGPVLRALAGVEPRAAAAVRLEAA